MYSHGCRVVLLEKEVECQVVYVEPDSACEELAELNPYNETPTLLDRDLVLYGSQIINEYLDERLPHPPLMPVDPVNRGRARLMMMRFDREWLQPVDRISRGEKDGAETTLQSVRDGLISLSPLLSEHDYVLGEEISLVDCYVVPLLWRLPSLGIELPRQARPVSEYADRLFARSSFKSSLSDIELELR